VLRLKSSDFLLNKAIFITNNDSVIISHEIFCVIVLVRVNVHPRTDHEGPDRELR
jgi:hypothetical protein